MTDRFAELSAIQEGGVGDEEGDEEEEGDSGSEFDCGTISRNQPVEEEYVDTDLDIEVDKCEFDSTGRRAYLEKCKHHSIVPITYFLRHLTDRHVSLAHHGIASQGMKALQYPLLINTQINSLDLEDNGLEGEGAEYAAFVIKENCYLTALNLANNRLGRRGCYAVCRMLSNNTTLLKINLSGNHWGDAEAKYLSDFMLENATIKEINLSHNNFGHTPSTILANAISDNDSMDALDLSWNHFRLKSAMNICEGIATNSRLRVVNLAMNGLGNEGALGLADILKLSGTVTHIDVSNNRIGITGAIIIARAMEGNADLMKVLKIGFNPLTIAGIKAIFKAMCVEGSVLEELDFSGIEIDKVFRKMKNDLCAIRDIKILHGLVLSDYKIIGTKDKKAFGTLAKDITTENIMEVLGTYYQKHQVNIDEILSTAREDKKFNIKDFVNISLCNGVDVTEEDASLLDKMAEVFKAADTGLIDFSTLKYVEKEKEKEKEKDTV